MVIDQLFKRKQALMQMCVLLIPISVSHMPGTAIDKEVGSSFPCSL